MNGQQGPQGDSQDEFLKVGIMSAISIIVIVTIILQQIGHFNAAVGAITWVHILPFAYAQKVFPFLGEIPYLGAWLFKQCNEVEIFLSKGGYALMGPKETANGIINTRNVVLAAGGRACLFIYGPGLIWIALRGRIFRVDVTYRTFHTLESMIFAQSEIWTTSRLARHINPLKQKEISPVTIAQNVRKQLKAGRLPGRLLPRAVVHVEPAGWGRSLRPEEFMMSRGLGFDVERYDIMTSGDLPLTSASYEFKSTWEKLDIDGLSDILGEQLRSPWKGADALRPIHRALLSVMAMFYGYDIDGGNKMLNDLGLIADSLKGKAGKMDDAILAEPDVQARIAKALSSDGGRTLLSMAEGHAYVESAFPTFLAMSRKDRGVLPAPAFNWLKAEDRTMWYILNNIGNEAIMAEAAGAIAHNRAELQIGRPIWRPAVYQAARAFLEDYLDMTEARIASRHKKEEHRKITGDYLNTLRAKALGLDQHEGDDLSADDA
jgi:hypothetical protein